MKKIILVSMAAMTSISAFASSHVCAGERIYSSSVRVDSGAKPPVGTVIGTNAILFDRQVLVSFDDIEGLFVEGSAPYQVSLGDDLKVLEDVSGPALIDKTYKVTATLNRVDSQTGAVLEQIATEPVVCRDLQRFVP